VKTKILIVYESADGAKAFPVAKVEDRCLLTAAARSAIEAKRTEAEGLSAFDSDLGMIASEEANRLERVLSALIPELRRQGSERTMVSNMLS
jgi:hypothetical protein